MRIKNKLIETGPLCVFLILLSWALHSRLLAAADCMLLAEGLLLGVCAPRLGRIFNRCTRLLSSALNSVALFIFYYAVFTPMALLRRVFIRDDLRLRKGMGDSYFERRAHVFSREDFEKPW